MGIPHVTVQSLTSHPLNSFLRIAITFVYTLYGSSFQTQYKVKKDCSVVLEYLSPLINLLALLHVAFKIVSQQSEEMACGVGSFTDCVGTVRVCQH